VPVADAATAAVLFLSCFFILFFLLFSLSLPFLFHRRRRKTSWNHHFLSYLFISPPESSKRRGISPPADEYQTLDGTELLYLSTNLYNPSSIHTAIITHHRSNLHLHFDVFLLPFFCFSFFREHKKKANRHNHRQSAAAIVSAWWWYNEDDVSWSITIHTHTHTHTDYIDGWIKYHHTKDKKTYFVSQLFYLLFSSLPSLNHH
jgi:hypothetical protein